MSRTIDRLKQLRLDLVALQRIKKKMDPASGITVSVMRGMESEESQEVPVKLQICEHMDEILDLLISATEGSEKLYVMFCKNELAELRQAVGE